MATAGRSSDDAVTTATPQASPGTVLMFSFVAPKGYVATSYPHPIKEAKEANPDETRNIAVSNNVPASLLKCIESSVGKEQPSQNPETTKCYTLEPGCYFMHITCWRPNPLDEEDDDFVPFEESKESLWLAYSWAERPSHQWLPGKNPEHPQDIHPTLGRYVRDIHGGPTRGGGHPSHFALGETSESFFIRLSDDKRNWHYRYHGLPERCMLAIQNSMAATKKYKDRKDPKGRCPYNLQHCTFGRLRAVTLGQGGGWILFREEQWETDYGGKNLPTGLLEGLEYGQRYKQVINQAVLNPHHAQEYVLAFDDGSVFYSFHESFQDDFDRIAREWCGDRLTYKPHPELLTDDDYPNGALADEDSASETTPVTRPSRPQERGRPAARRNPHPRSPTAAVNGRQTPVTPPGHDPYDPSHTRVNSGLGMMVHPMGTAPQPLTYGQPYAAGYGAAPYGPPWGPPYWGAWGPPPTNGPPPAQMQSSQLPGPFRYHPYTGQQLQFELGDHYNDSSYGPPPQNQNQNQNQTPIGSDVRTSTQREEQPAPQGGTRSRWRAPWSNRDGQR